MGAKLASAGVSVGEVKRYPGFAYSLCDGQDPEGNVFSFPNQIETRVEGSAQCR